MKVQNITLQNISRNYYLRLDYKINAYHSHIRKDYKNGWKVKDFLKIIKANQTKPENFDEGYLIELEHILSGDVELNNVKKVNEIGSDKVILNQANFAYCKLETGKGYFIALPEDIPDYDGVSLIVGSTELVPCRVSINNKIAKYYLTHFKEIFNMFLSGKTHRRIHEIEFLNIELPKIKISNTLLDKIISIEKEISKLKTQIKEPKIIVDEVFSKYFKLDLKQYSNLEKKHIFGEDLFNLSKSAQLRSSLKFHHPKFDFVLKKIKEFKTVKLKQLLKEPVRRGVQPEYEEEGGILVIKTINVNKEGYIDLTETEFVSDEFYNKVKKKAGIQQGDILITSTGEGRGKVSLYDLDEPAIIDTHISIVRCKEDVNKKYLTYFLLSSMGENQLSILEQAIKGTPEIYPREIEKLIVIYPPSEIQNKIVEEIETKLNEQRKITRQIEKLKQEIDKLIEKAILDNKLKND
ncbi:MAG: hypothetical protein KatS3mg097_547 [Candidatus Parcubacteria bacterium]|nr:MAG: hypothetical protein KatS3mg097_547 [Candidatus Parcubacteria bacterium]